MLRRGYVGPVRVAAQWAADRSEIAKCVARILPLVFPDRPAAAPRRANRSVIMTSHVCLNVCAGSLIGLAACLVEANVSHQRVAPDASHCRVADAPRFAPGTAVPVRIGDRISSEIARRGDSWRGITLREVSSLDGALVPRGSAVSGIVNEVRSARGARAALGLRVITIDARGRSTPIRASVDPRVSIEPLPVSARPGIESQDPLRAARWTTGETGITTASSPGDPIILREGIDVTFRIQ
jgi:hypothetical protein